LQHALDVEKRKPTYIIVLLGRKKEKWDQFDQYKWSSLLDERLSKWTKKCGGICTQFLLTHLPDVDGLGVRHGRERRVDGSSLRRHGEEGGDAKRDACGHGVRVQPEADPGYDDEHTARNVDGDQVVAELPLEDQVDGEAAVLA
jgi:hypothetical protein